MPDFTIKNLKELEDAVADVPGDFEGRFGRNPLDSQHLGVSYWRYGPNFRSIGHRHREQEEAYIVVGGSGRIKLDDELVELKPWDVIRVAPTVARGLEGGPEGIEVIAIGSDRPEGGDGEQVQDFWTD